MESGEPLQIAPDETEVDVVGDPNRDFKPRTASQDTIWIAEWTFDAPGGGCTSEGWVVQDNRILNVRDDSEYWHIDNRFAGTGPIVNRAAVLSKHDLCWAQDGYGNDNDFSIILKYSGSAATLSFVKRSDSEPGFDFVRVECDSLGLSEQRANPTTNPQATSPAVYRREIFQDDGFDTGSSLGPLALIDFGPGTHEVYIRFISDGAFSDEDGDYPTALDAGLVVDNIVVTGGLAYSEDFEGALHPNVTLIETSQALPYRDAPWLRVFPHITDNDRCPDNMTCAWLGSDPSLPAASLATGYGPSGAVVRNWLDDVAISPWINLASTPGAAATVLRFRRFGGNNFATSSIVHQWNVRSKTLRDNPDSPAPGDSIECVSVWGHTSSFNSVGTFRWVTVSGSPHLYYAAEASQIQLRFRTTDWQYMAGIPPLQPIDTGPGPYWDDVRVGRWIPQGPVMSPGIDSRTQAQDGFPTVIAPSIVPGQHFTPDGGNRFGTCAFSMGADINPDFTRIVTGDSIVLDQVRDLRGAGGIANVRFYGAIVAGPHVGRVPGPYSSTGGFFQVNADSTRDRNGILVANRWHLDLDDFYFRGGDVLQYFWAATDNAGGFSSLPAGLDALPTSVAQAEQATGGLHEVNFLPVIDWDPGYLAAIAADPEGDVEPTAAQIAASSQRNCILYYQKLNSRRRSGDVNRSSFMFTLDQLGYRGDYDVYDVQGYGNTTNQLGTRANVGQASHYALIVQDDGRSNLVPNIPTSIYKFDQATWYRSYLGQGATSGAGSATLWIIGEDTAFLHRTEPLISQDLGVAIGPADNDQALTINPTVRGHAANSFANGGVVDFTGDEFILNGGCPTLRVYDVADPAAGATQTHRYAAGATQGRGAIIMNRNAAAKWNTVWMGFGWFDIRFAGAPTSPTPGSVLASKILGATVAAACNGPDDGTDVGDDALDSPPAATALHANVPNPFNPTTRIGFDLAVAGPVRLSVYDAAGRLVRTLVDGERAPGRYVDSWTGIDGKGLRVASGVYFYRLDAPAFAQTRKMVLLQ